MSKPVPRPVVLIDPPRREWTRQQPCLCCEPGKQSTPTESAHVHTKRNAGDDHNLIPLCGEHHKQQHAIGVVSFASMHGKDLEAEASRYWDAYDKEQGW